MKKEGFVPKNFQLGPSFISFALVIVGVVLMLLSVGFYTLADTREIDLGLLPSMNLYVGIVVTISSAAYLLNRRRKIAEARIMDERRFRNWAKTEYGLDLTHDQVEQLFYYGSTVVNNRKYVLHYEIEDNQTIAYIYSEQEWLDDAKTNVLATIQETHSHPITPPPVATAPLETSTKEEPHPGTNEINPTEIDNTTSLVLEEETTPKVAAPNVNQEHPPVILENLTLPELKNYAKNHGLHGYSTLKKQELINFIHINDKV